MIPRLAVVTTAYNHAQFLEESLESVARQTVPCVHVVVNDASPDGTQEILDRWLPAAAHRVCVELPENRGLARAFHAGVEQLPPEVQWILKVDADDKIDERYVEEILRAADEDPSRNVIFAPAKHFGARTDVYYYEPFVVAKMRSQFFIPGPAAYRRELWDAVGGYDITMRSAEDWDFYIRAQEAVGLVPHQILFPAGLYWYYRMHGGPRASDDGIKRLRYLQSYWQGHTRETAIAGSRSWGAWCAERGLEP